MNLNGIFVKRKSLHIVNVRPPYNLQILYLFMILIPLGNVSIISHVVDFGKNVLNLVCGGGGGGGSRSLILWEISNGECYILGIKTFYPVVYV